jgi:hypothetical protein
LQQNPKTESRWAQLAREGHRVMQFLSAGRDVGMVDGKVRMYGGKKKSATMVRAFDILAGLPKELTPKKLQKDKPQKRKEF